jgi:hypothetical protein
MSNVNLRNITNNFQDVRLASLATWRRAGEITPCDRGGPYVVTQEGYDPEDPKVILNEFVLGRSGKWLSLADFYQMPEPERRAGFVFGTAAEVMKLMSDLPSKVQIIRPSPTEPGTSTAPESDKPDEMAAALRAGKARSSGTAG